MVKIVLTRKVSKAYFFWLLKDIYLLASCVFIMITKYLWIMDH